MLQAPCYSVINTRWGSGGLVGRRLLSGLGVESVGVERFICRACRLLLRPRLAVIRTVAATCPCPVSCIALGQRGVIAELHDLPRRCRLASSSSAPEILESAACRRLRPLDFPMRPAHGRIIRCSNVNHTVSVFAYAAARRLGKSRGIRHACSVRLSTRMKPNSPRR